MIHLSMKLNEEVQGIMSTFDPIQTMVGEKLVYFHKFFMIYREYCNNFMKGQTIIKNAKKNPEVLKIQEKLVMDL